MSGVTPLPKGVGPGRADQSQGDPFLGRSSMSVALHNRGHCDRHEPEFAEFAESHKG